MPKINGDYYSWDDYHAMEDYVSGLQRVCGEGSIIMGLITGIPTNPRPARYKPLPLAGDEVDDFNQDVEEVTVKEASRP